MAKKKAVSKKTENKKIAFPLRLDPDVMEGVRKLADDAEVSLNQLLHGLARFAVKNGFAGEPEFLDEEKRFIRVKRQPGVVAFGRPAAKFSKEEAREYEQIVQEEAPAFKDDGEYYFSLDFTQRFVVRED